MASSSRTSDRFEQSLEEWYRQRPERLEYLDLAFPTNFCVNTTDGFQIHCFGNPTEKHIFHSPHNSSFNTLVDLSLLSVHNQSILFDRVSLQTRSHLKHLHKIQEKLSDSHQEFLENQKHQDLKLKSIEWKLEEVLHSLHTRRPITKKEVNDLVSEIAQQPKLAEQQALKISQDLEKRFSQIEELIQETRSSLGG